MVRISASCFRSLASVARNVPRRCTPANAPKLAASTLSESFSSRASRLRAAIVSLQPLHTASSQALFVSRLSFGSQDPVFLVQDDDGT